MPCAARTARQPLPSALRSLAETQQPRERAMRNSATHSGKELVKEIARLQTQLEDLAETVNARGGEVAENSLRSARELIAKYGDTAKSMAEDAVNFKDKASVKVTAHTE